jgi:ferritin
LSWRAPSAANRRRSAHAFKLDRFLAEAGARVAVPAVEAPRADVASAEAAVKLAAER